MLLRPLAALVTVLSLQAAPVELRFEVLSHRAPAPFPVAMALTVVNPGPKALPATGWCLGFSYSRTLDTSQAKGPLRLEHVTGDLYRLVPGQGFPGLPMGASLRVELRGEGASLNRTDAPSGAYLVLGGQARPVPVEVLPFKPEALARPAGDPTPRVDPEAQFKLNGRLQPRPASPLPFPTPLQMEAGTGHLTLPRDLQLEAAPGLEGEAALAADWLTPLLGRRPGLGKGALRLRLGPVPGQTSPEAYVLRVGEGSIEVTGLGPSGVFHGLQTLRSLLGPDLTLPELRILDAPRFPYRGFMLDVARHFHPKARILKVLDLMARLKLNVFHFHLTDDEGWRLAIPGLPELTEVGARRGHGEGHLEPLFGSGPQVDTLPGSGHYTREDCLEILRFAKARHIQVIPELEMPGHARAAVKAMAVRAQRGSGEDYRLQDPGDRSAYRSIQMYRDNVMDPGLPSTYAFIAKVVAETVALYKEAGAPLTTIHMGGDEVPAGVWEGSPACQTMVRDLGLRSVDDLWYVFYSRVEGILRHHGLRTSGWEEIVLRKPRLRGPPKLIPNPGFFGKGMRAYVWNNVMGWGNEDLPYRLANAGFEVVLSPVSNLYFDLAPTPDPREVGQYWGGYVDVEKAFRLIPLDYYRNQKEDAQGQPLAKEALAGKDGLTDYGAEHLLGLQGCLWGENLVDEERLDTFLVPKVFGLAERAWAPDPTWAREQDPAKAEGLYTEAWSRFTWQVSDQLRHLDREGAAWRYHIPAPGLRVERRRAWANLALPGFTLRYTLDGTEPTPKSPEVQGPLEAREGLRVAAFDGRGRRGLSIRR